MKKILFTTTIFLNILFINVSYAQETNDAANFTTGEIICSSNLQSIGNSLRKSQLPYDELIVGVFQKSDIADPHFAKNPVIHEGICSIKYNSENGTIKKGDPLASSSEAGVAMKAIKSGMIIGIALEDATASNGLVKMRILIQYIKQ